MEAWIDKTWKSMMKGNIKLYACGNGFLNFLFEIKEDKDVILKNKPYFFGSSGMYLNKWSLDFNPYEDILNANPVWVKLPRLPLLLD